MADVTDVLGLPFPEGADANDVPADMQALAERVDEVPGIESLTSAEIAALTSLQKPAGRVVWNSTTSKLQVSNGTSFSDLPYLLLAGGTMTGALTMSGAGIAMGSQKVTGLAAATANGDAVRYEQLTALGTWASYTCTVTGSVSNPTGVTQDCEYTQIGKVVHVRMSVTIPQATKGSGNYEFSLPVTADATLGPCGSAHRTSVPEYGGYAWLTSTTTCGIGMNAVRITDSAINTTTVTFQMLLTYQAA